MAKTLATSAEETTPSLDGLIAEVSGIVTPPVVCARLYELIQSDESTAWEIGELVSVDPNLTARLLKIVNSAFFGFPGKVDSIARAVTILGTQELYNLVLAISAVRAFSRLGAGLVPLDIYWRHSVLTGVLARNLARAGGAPHAERSFVAGLLHDIGSPVIYTQLPALVANVTVRDELALCAVERELLEFTHADVGARLLESWQLPDEIANTIRTHHDNFSPPLEVAPDALKLAERLANTVPSYAFFPLAEGADPEPLDEALMHGLGEFSTEPVESVLAAALEDTEGLLKSLFGQM